MRREWRLVGGVVGPAAFIAAWATLGSRREGYSPVDDQISRLAAAGSSTQAAMTAGLAAFSIGVGLYAEQLRQSLSSRTGAAALVSAAGAAGIAATPLGSPLGGAPHAIAAGISYVALVAMPLLAARPLAVRGAAAAAMASAAAGLAAGAVLAASLVADRAGLWQRAGLTVADAWLITSAVVVARQSPRRAAPNAARR